MKKKKDYRIKQCSLRKKYFEILQEKKKKKR